MASLPWRAISLTSLISSALFTSRHSQWSTVRFSNAFFGLWLAQGFAWCVWVFVLYPKFFSPLRGLPEPKGNSFFMGQFERIRAEPTGVPHREWVNSIPNDGIIRYLGPFNQERLLIVSPKALSEVLVTKNYDFQKPPQLRESIGRILGVGVLLAEGEQHKMQRRSLMPAFAFRHIKDLYPVFWRISRDAVQVMTEAITKGAAHPTSAQDSEKAPATGRNKSTVIEAGSWASRATLDIIGVAGLGRDFGAIRNPKNELNETYRALFQPSKQAQLLALLSIVLPTFVVRNLPVQRNNDITAAARTIRSVCRDMIQEKKEKLSRKELTDVDILSVALESGGFTDENLVDQLMTFLAAGHETTATAMTWATYMLAKNPDVQTRLRQEIRDNLPSMDSDQDVSSLQIDHLPYLNAVCNEILRYYAPVALTLREAAVDTTIVGHHVPKGTRIVLVPWANHFDKEMWGPDADEFNPDRWMAKNENDKLAASGGASSNYAFMTFLHGPRSCIGQSFAKAEFACLLASWIGRFEFELYNKEENDEKKVLIKGGVTARPAKGLYVHATVIDGW
ncbi:cytochrome P450 [Xylariales sp. AK1849]|nr:cytochrome P450 [Xylariales sp. AK1849]